MARHFRLEGPQVPGAVRFLTGLHVSLQEGQRTSVVTITRTGSFTDPRYGRFEITASMLLSMVENFRKRTYGQDIFLDVAHQPSNGAAAKVLDLFVEGARLRARVEWTPYGVEAVSHKGYRYLSAEFVEDYVDNEQGQHHGPMLLGAGLTVRPVIKRLDPVQLAESDVPTWLHPELIKSLSEEAQITMNKYLDQLRATLHGLKTLSEDAIKTILSAFESAAKALGEDEAALKALTGQFEAAGKQLSEQIAAGKADPAAPITLSVQAGNTGLSADDVKKLLAEERAAAETAAKQLAETKDALVKQFSDAITEAKGLPDDVKKTLGEAADLITPDMTADQVKRLAEQQIAMGNQLVAARQLSGMGYQVAGNVRIAAGQDNTALALQEQIDGHLRGSLTAANGRLHVPQKDKVTGFAARVLGEFDRIHAERLAQESRVLAGDTSIGHIDVPASFQRTVIREALHDLRILEIVQTLTDPGAQQTTQVPYESRDTSEVVNDGIVFEGQGIPRAGVRQHMDLAYVLAMKLSLKLSNEVMHFSRSSSIDWDAYGRNVESNARVMRELITRRIANEIQRTADSYLAADITGESVAAQLTGAVSTIKTAQFPIVRPHQRRDMQGNAVGSVENGITLVLDGDTITPWDGTGAQEAGTYYRITNANLGYIQLVNAAGTPVTPDLDEAVCTIAYSYATNVVKFDLDFDDAETTFEKHLNGLLQKVGSRKAMMRSERYIEPTFALMSPTLNDMASNAEAFVVSLKRDGSDTNGAGDLERVKGIAAFGTNAPGIDLGDERILLGQRGTTSYVVAKPFATGTPFEAVDSLGRPTGEKVAYGEEYSAIHTPVPIRNRYTSVLVYSATGR